MSKRRVITVMVVFYGGLAVLMALILTNSLRDVIPASIAVRIGYNSEGYTAALLLAPWVQFVRPRLAGRRWEWPVAVGVGVAMAVIGVLLVETHLPSPVRTLNEAFFGLAVAIPYLQARRPVRAGVALTVSALTLAAIIAFNHTNTVTQYAEGWMLLVLIPISFDIVDRGILEPEVVTSRRRRYAWYATLVALPVLSSLVYHWGLFDGGFPAEWIRYEVRVHESFIGTLLTVLFFAVGLGRTGRDPAGADRRAAASTLSAPTATG